MSSTLFFFYYYLSHDWLVWAPVSSVKSHMSQLRSDPSAVTETCTLINPALITEKWRLGHTAYVSVLEKVQERIPPACVDWLDKSHYHDRISFKWAVWIRSYLIPVILVRHITSVLIRLDSGVKTLSLLSCWYWGKSSWVHVESENGI